MDMELVPLDTTGIEVYKNMFKHGDTPITFGDVSPWSKLCFVILDTLIILCDHISWTLQLMDVELVPWETAKIGIYKGMLKYADIHKRFETASLWNWTGCVVLVRMHCMVTSCDRISWTYNPWTRNLYRWVKQIIIVELLWHPISFKTMSPFMSTLFWYFVVTQWIIISLKWYWYVKITPLNAICWDK